MIREARWRERLGSPARRLVDGALAIVLVAAIPYGLSDSVTAFVPA